MGGEGVSGEGPGVSGEGPGVSGEGPGECVEGPGVSGARCPGALVYPAPLLVFWCILVLVCQCSVVQ